MAGRDTILHLYGPQSSPTGSWSAADPLAVNDDFGGSMNSHLVVSLPGDGTYLVLVQEFSGSSGQFQLGASCTGDACTSAPKPLNIDVLLFDEIETCFVGDRCTSGSCVGLRDDDQKLVVAFQDNSNYRFVQPDDPAVASAEVSKCVRLPLSSVEQDAVRAQIQLYRDNVHSWTGGAIDLTVRYHRVPPLALGLSRFGDGPWVAPWNMAGIAGRYLSRDTYFTIVTQGVRDSVTGLHQSLGGCGGAVGAEWGRAGAGHAWVPKTGGSFFFECANDSVYTHEWLHQLDWAVRNLSGFDDLYDNQFPACGQADPAPLRWFPDIHACTSDPDYTSCGATECGAGSAWNEHVLRAHWSPGKALVTNHCRNGIQDFGETAPDAGGNCLASSGRSGEVMPSSTASDQTSAALSEPGTVSSYSVEVDVAQASSGDLLCQPSTDTNVWTLRVR